MMRLKSVVVLGLLVFWSLAACTLLDNDAPEIGSIEIEGAAGDSVGMVVSTAFVAGPGAEGDTVLVEILRADTVRRALPYSATVDISEFNRLLVLVFESDSVMAPVRMRVAIDGEPRFDESSVIADRPLQFIFVFNQGPISVEPRL